MCQGVPPGTLQLSYIPNLMFFKIRMGEALTSLGQWHILELK